MIGFPNAKINIGLHITSRLANGYHELKSLMVPTGFCDILEFIPAANDSLELSGIEIPGNKKENLLWKVLSLMRKKNDIPPVKIHLHKAIPAGTGLGGGSADASFFINMLNEFFNLKISLEEKEGIASKIGSDCPFFIRNKPAMITGTGTTLHPFDINLKGHYLVIVFPGFSISTAKAYSGVIPGPEKVPLEDLLELGLKQWKQNILNVFERSLFKDYTVLSELKSELYYCGADYASLSGSGSALYGIFRKKPVLSEKIGKVMIYEGLI
jgi:4-diphosphocytidyl-2-C-methyl-D-erythritol kinase